MPNKVTISLYINGFQINFINTYKLFNFYPTGGPQVSCQNGFGAID